MGFAGQCLIVDPLLAVASPDTVTEGHLSLLRVELVLQGYCTPEQLLNS